MKNESIVKKFLKKLGDEKLMVVEAGFIPVLLLVDWLNFYDGKDFKNIYPTFFYKKGALVKNYISLTRYREVSKRFFRDYLNNKLSIEQVKQRYEIVKKKIEKAYDNYYLKKQSDFLKALDQTHKDLQELVALTLFVDQLDQQVIQEILAERGSTLNLEQIWKFSQVLGFLSFDSRNEEEIMRTVSKRLDAHRLQHIFASYTHVPTFAEVKKKISQINIKETAREIEKKKQEILNNKKEKEKQSRFLSKEERKILDFIDWASFLRDDRKTIINKSDVLLFNLVKDLYEKWNVPKDLVALSFVFDVLKGKEYIIQNLDKIRKRRKKIMLIYYGQDKYEENSEEQEKTIKLLDERILVQNKAQLLNAVKGETASIGHAKGCVKIVFHKEEFKKFNEGDILVTGMTRPEFVPLMKKAAAIITDEGGITSHAAIVARELKKPCIIGTKIATKVLKDGDIVEVDANKGVVRKIK